MEIKALGEPKREDDGTLAFSYYIEVFSIIKKHARYTFEEEKKQLLFKRRELLRNNKMTEYNELAIEMIAKEETISIDILTDALKHIGVNE